MTEEEKRKLAIERDSFIKTSIIAIGANYFAMNKNVPHDHVIGRSVRMAEAMWDEFMAWRTAQLHE